jgi:hydrogenase maturation protein HypF
MAGWVRNECGSVRIAVEGLPESVAAFIDRLPTDLPPLARIDAMSASPRPPTGAEGFAIIASDTDPTGRLPISPDVAICGACTEELFEPTDRRYRYPFITCTDCGPRFTVIEEMPYDRERSTMRAFPMCAECQGEYRDPGNRRYHSQTNACATCGPRIWAVERGREVTGTERSLQWAAALLAEGKILAVRGLGGFHLAVDASNDEAVQRLRQRKHRQAKPLAVMVRTLDEARSLGSVGAVEAELLVGPERPIVLLASSGPTALAPSVAPGLSAHAVMLAYTPLHHLLLEAAGGPLVMTSGNASEEPIATGNEEARARLDGIADGCLLHDRDIVARYDDSVVRVVSGAPIFLRRARGYAPLPVVLPVPSPLPLLAVGPHLKNTFALVDEDAAFVGQHIGDLENLETLEHFQESVDRFRTLFRVEPQVVVRDAHPGYLSTRIAEEWGAERVIEVQHHHAHVAAVLAEHRRDEDVLGIAFDGTGYGADGAVWGAEFLVAGLRDFRRVAHLRYAPLPGSELAVRNPWRTALGYASLRDDDSLGIGRSVEGIEGETCAVAAHQARTGLNAPPASSMGRLFDAAAAVLGIRQVAAYEGQAGMEVEALAAGREGSPLPFPIREAEDGGPLVLDPLPLLETLAQRLAGGRDVRDLSADFHASVVAATIALSLRLAHDHALGTVALGGGCFQNAILLGAVSSELSAKGLEVLVPRSFSPNDGCICLGQAASAAARLATERGR